MAVFGGGVAGLTVAHELAERGFDVTVYERRAFGGKARSTQVAGTATGGRAPLPGEHGFRVEFGFYRNLPDTMRRIPFPGNANGVFDNLVATPGFTWAREGGRDLMLPIGPPSPGPRVPQQVVDLLIGLGAETDLPPEAIAHFANRMTVFLSSCDARRLGQWDNTTWADFLQTSRYSADYRKLLGETFSHIVQASKTERTSAKFSAWVLELVAYNLLGRGATGPLFRVLNQPTNDAWIDPWLVELRRLGVRLRSNQELVGLEMRRGRLAGARLRSPGGRFTTRADWYVCALPVEQARRLWTRAIAEADPQLPRMHNLDTAWMNGVQFYLSEEASLDRCHIDYVDSPWKLSSISQARHWARDFSGSFGDGRARDCLSAISSDWTVPGILYDKPAQDCSDDEIAQEFWEQIKRHVNDSGTSRLRDEMLLSWVIDPGLVRRRGRLTSEDPLVLPTAAARQDRPDVGTAIPNLLLAGDYLKSDWEVANMETANYNARRAVNALLERAGASASPCKIIASYRPPEWEALKRLDANRYRRGDPNLFDTDLPDTVANGLLSSGSPDRVRKIMTAHVG